MPLDIPVNGSTSVPRTSGVLVVDASVGVTSAGFVVVDSGTLVVTTVGSTSAGFVVVVANVVVSSTLGWVVAVVGLTSAVVVVAGGI